MSMWVRGSFIGTVSGHWATVPQFLLRTCPSHFCFAFLHTGVQNRRTGQPYCTFHTHPHRTISYFVDRNHSRQLNFGKKQAKTKQVSWFVFSVLNRCSFDCPGLLIAWFIQSSMWRGFRVSSELAQTNGTMEFHTLELDGSIGLRQLTR